jgi:hypothetical protein
VQSIADTSEMKNIEVSRELEMGEKSYDDLTFLITADFFPVAHVGTSFGVPQ